jgi:hypothetical protein
VAAMSKSWQSIEALKPPRIRHCLVWSKYTKWPIWQLKIQEALESAKIAILLVSPSLQCFFNQSNGMNNITQIRFRFWYWQTIDVGDRPYRILEFRPFTFGKVKPQIHRIWDGQYMEKQDGCIKIKPA